MYIHPYAIFPMSSVFITCCICHDQNFSQCILIITCYSYLLVISILLCFRKGRSYIQITEDFLVLTIQLSDQNSISMALLIFIQDNLHFVSECISKKKHSYLVYKNDNPMEISCLSLDNLKVVSRRLLGRQITCLQDGRELTW